MKPSAALSARGQKNVDSIMPKIKGAVAERTKSANTNIDLSTAENELIRDELLQICKQSVASGLERRHFSYPRGFSGDPDMLFALAAFFNTYFSPHKAVETSHLSTAPGASAQLDAMLYNICDPGEGVLIPAPYWNGFDFQFTVRSSIAIIPVTVETDFATSMTTALIASLRTALAEAVVPVRAIVLSNPHNPLGLYYPKETLEACVKFCQEQNLHYVSDEVYAMSSLAADPTGEGQKQSSQPFVSALSLDLSSLEVDPSRVHVVWSISKDLGSSGMRLGCAITQSNEELAVGLALAANTQTSSLSAIYTTALLTSPRLSELFAANSLRLRKGYDMVTTMLQRHRIPFIPVSAGVYVFAKIVPGAKTWEEEAAMVQRAKEAGVLVSSGRAYHGQESEKGWARITFAVEQSTLKEGVRRLETVLAADRSKRGVKRPSEEASESEWSRRAPDAIGPCATPS